VDDKTPALDLLEILLGVIQEDLGRTAGALGARRGRRRPRRPSDAILDGK
jgi:hypothetical protein